VSPSSAGRALESARLGTVGGTLMLVALLLVLAVGRPSLGAEPTQPTAASPAPVVGTGDSRSDGGGPGIVGSPVAIAVGVILLGAITAAGTLLVVRVTRSRGG